MRSAFYTPEPTRTIVLEYAGKLTESLLPDAAAVVLWKSDGRGRFSCVYTSGTIEKGTRRTVELGGDHSSSGPPVVTLCSGDDAEALTGSPYMFRCATCLAGSREPHEPLVIAAIGFADRPADTPGWLSRLMALVREQERATHAASRVSVDDMADRIRIAEDIHREIGGLVTALQFSLKLGVSDPKAPPPGIEEALELVNRLSDATRDATRRVYPLELARFGLPVAVRVVVDRVNRDSKRTFRFICDIAEERRFPPAVESAAHALISAWIEALNEVSDSDTSDDNARIELAVESGYLHINLTSTAKSRDIAGGKLPLAVPPERLDRIRVLGGHSEWIQTSSDMSVLRSAIPVPSPAQNQDGDRAQA